MEHSITLAKPFGRLLRGEAPSDSGKRADNETLGF